MGRLVFHCIKVPLLGVMAASLLLVVQGPVVSAAELDMDFRSGNDILFFDPNHEISCAPAAAPIMAPATGIAGGTVPTNFSLGSGAPERPVNLMKNLMSDYSLTAEQAAGIVGNFMHESGGEDLPPDMNQGMVRGAPNPFMGGGKAYGWAQWDGGRKRNFLNYAIQNGYMASMSVSATDGANYAFLKHELATDERSTIPAVKRATSVSGAVIAFEGAFERAGKPAIGPRTALANKLIGWYRGDAGGTTPVTGGGDTTTVGGGSTAPAGGCGAQLVGGGGSTTAGSFGQTSFPLGGGKAAVNNPNMFANGTTDKGGHPYTSYDILADTGTPVLAFISGTVTMVGQDRCPGRIISIFNEEHNVVVSYLHLSMNRSTHIKVGDTVQAGDRVGIVGSTREGCTIPHLHIDVVKGRIRVGCSRLNCPRENAAQFIDIGPDLFKAWEGLDAPTQA